MLHLVTTGDIKGVNQTAGRSDTSKVQCPAASVPCRAAAVQYCCRRFTFLAVACSKVAWPHPQSACARSGLENGLTFRCPSAIAVLMH